LSKGRLDLAGFTLTGGANSAIVCERHCTIEGNGGTIRGAGSNGVASPNGFIRVSNTTLEDNGYAGAYAGSTGGPLEGGISISNSTVHNNEWGLIAKQLSVTDTTVTGHIRAGLAASRRVEIVNSEVSFNGRSALQAQDRCKVDVVNSTLEGNGTSGSGGGVGGQRVMVSGSSIINNHTGGVYGKAVRVEQSTLTGNDVEPGCDSIECADISAAQLRVRTGVTCDTSAVIDWNGGPTGETWGVCAED
jgi:hypothetical protein